MKQYRVTINGSVYEVGIEEIAARKSVAAVSPTPAKCAPHMVPAAKPAAPVKPVTVKGKKITSPMPGNILSVNVKVGDSVRRGQVLMILEAMKMENEIVADCDGTVASVSATAGSPVETDAVLCVIC